MVIVVVLSLLLIASAYGGMVNPEETPWGALIAMCFPGFAVLTVVGLFVLLLMRMRIHAVVGGVALFLCIPAIVEYCPVNFRKSVGDDGPQQFRLITFNCMWWGDYQSGDTIPAPNASVQFILDQKPDMFATQEGSRIVESLPLGITRAMVDTINQRYPYQFFSGERGQMFYSRFPVTRIVSEDLLNGTGVCVAYRISIQGHLLTLLNVHLQSIGLTPEDKALYEQLLKAKSSTAQIKDVHDRILEKLFAAFRHRALQAEFVRSIIDDTNGNLIVCGDFNDIPGCYAIRTIRNGDLHDAWAEAGTGPGISFRANHLYFRIDHCFYRGDFTALDAEVAHSGLSDHYPMVVDFVWTDE